MLKRQFTFYPLSFKDFLPSQEDLPYKLVTFGKGPNTFWCACHDNIPVLQRGKRLDFAENSLWFKNHQANISFLPEFAVDPKLQGERLHLIFMDADKIAEHRGAIKGFGPLPRKPLSLQLALCASVRQVQAKSKSSPYEGWLNDCRQKFIFVPEWAAPL